MSHPDDHLAYGHYNPQASNHPRSGDSARGLVGDTFKKLRDTYKSHQPQPPNSSHPGSSSYLPQGDPSHPSGPYHDPSYHGHASKPDKLSGLLEKIQGTVVDIGSEVAGRVGTALDPQYAQYGQKPGTTHRFGSFAPPRPDNEVKWYVDGCSYFWAVSRALESARESIWILDWWLSPELYLRRPPAKNEQYRLDRMLQAAAQRGVRVNVIVYKEVPEALTLCSSHTKHHLEALHPNIAVFRHPDHLPRGDEFKSTLDQDFQNLSLNASSLAKLPEDTIKSLYGMDDDVILYWAHHEKFCMIDGCVAFMGGLDLCFGRWDTHQHSIADLHPRDLNEIVFPGQDYNNARVLDFHDVSHWRENQLDRKVTSRMGWSDISVSLHGPAVEDLRRHFVERWNFVYSAKYETRNESRYGRLAMYGRQSLSAGHQSTSSSGTHQPSSQPQHQSSASSIVPPPAATGQGGSTHQPAVSGPTSQPPSAYGYTYTGDSFPPPPPGPPPGKSSESSQPQATNPTPSFPPPPGHPVTSSHGQGQGSNQAPYFPPPPSVPSPGQSSASVQSQGQGQCLAPSFPPPPGQPSDPSHSQGQSYSPAPYVPPPSQPNQPPQSRGVEDYEGTRGEGDSERGFGFNPRRFRGELSEYGNILRGELAGQVHQYHDRLTSFGRPALPPGHMNCQVLRSCCKWSNGTPTEHSIQDAYAAVIRNSEHFVYIENQFFITATGDHQQPVKNKIGAAIVERILRAAREGKKYKIMVVIPAIPSFAGDLADESMLGTRAIMEFQYNSINRGGNSIMEMIAKEGFNPMDYIRFYNLRNYDRINVNAPMADAEHRSGVNYDDARKQHDLNVAGQGGYGPGAPRSAFDTTAPFQRYQQAAQHVSGSQPSQSGRWDSVSECYMLNGEDIRNVPWEGLGEAEVDAFVSSELYIHSKVMIADDRVVICGSANLNDRSQLGTHDSEIAILVEDYTPVQSNMNGKPWTVSRFGASLRRELFRKHLGLLPPQDYQHPGDDFEPFGVPNRFDFDAPESQVVADPLSDTLESLWNTRARTNTEVFRKVFHAIPDDTVRDWATYKEFHGYYFRHANQEAQGQQVDGRPPRYEWGHVVRDNFPPGLEGVREVKELLSQVKGTLVEMPLMFLIEEDMAKEGLALNDLTEPIYT